MDLDFSPKQVEFLVTSIHYSVKRTIWLPIQFNLNNYLNYIECVRVNKINKLTLTFCKLFFIKCVKQVLTIVAIRKGGSEPTER